MERKALSLVFLIMLFLVASTNRSDVVTASSTTYIYVNPSVVSGVTPTNTFRINVSVTAAPLAYAWEMLVKWNPALLNVANIREGDFLHRWDTDPFTGEKTPKYTTTLLRSPKTFDEANIYGNMSIICSLLGDEPWASGDGWLFELGFTVKAEGSSVLSLQQTRLYDHMEAGAPAQTFYPNNDGFFFNTLFHDIAVTNVAASTTNPELDEPVAINVTVANEGNFTETFDVAAYADTIAYSPADPDILLVGDEIIVGTQSVTNLASGDTTKLYFTWNTTGVTEGNYTISAKSLLQDDNTSDDTFINGKVTTSPPLRHDIAVTNVVPSPTETTIGENVTVNVSLKNEGTFNETFYVTVYYNTTIIANQTNVSLTNGTSTTLTFTWNTEGVSEGTYTISAKVPSVNGESEADRADNTFTDGTVKVQAGQTSNILLYAVIAIVVIIAVAVVIYLFRFRK